MTYKDVIYNLNNEKQFTFSRYGEAEWACMLGEQGRDINGTVYTQELQRHLQSALKDKRTETDYIALTDNSKRLYGSQITAMTNHYGFDWLDADLFAKEWYEKGNIDNLLVSLEKYSVLLIAPNYYKYMSEQMHWGFCRIDHADWFNKNYDAIMYLLEKSTLFKEATVWIWVAGMGAKPAINQIRKIAPYTTHIDIGSALDPYTGFATRKYHRMKNPNLKPFEI